MKDREPQQSASHGQTYADPNSSMLSCRCYSSVVVAVAFGSISTLGVDSLVRSTQAAKRRAQIEHEEAERDVELIHQSLAVHVDAMPAPHTLQRRQEVEAAARQAKRLAKMKADEEVRKLTLSFHSATSLY